MAEAHPIHAPLVRYGDAPVSGFDLAYSADTLTPETSAVDAWALSATTTLARRLHRAGYHTAAIAERSDAFKRGSSAEAGFGVFHHSADAALTADGDAAGTLAPFAIAGLQLNEAPGAVAHGRDLAAPPEPDARALPAEMP